MFEVPSDAKVFKRVNKNKEKHRINRKKFVATPEVSDQSGSVKKFSINDLAITNQSSLIIRSNRNRKE